MLGKLRFYEHHGHGSYRPSPALEEVEILGLDSYSHKPALAWRLSSKPRSMHLWSLQAEVLMGDNSPVGWLDVYGWLYTNHTFDLRWKLTQQEVELLEERRRGHDLVLELRCSGIATVPDPQQDTSRLASVTTGTQVVIPRSDWEQALVNIAYQPARWLELPLESSHWPNWDQTIAQLQAAVGHLARGETHDVLRECLDLLERRRPAPNNKDSWRGVFDVDPHKEEGLQLLVSGIAGYLNKVGHHRHRTVRDASGNLLRTTVDQWEAEIAVALTQLLVAYLERLPVKP